LATVAGAIVLGLLPLGNSAAIAQPNPNVAPAIDELVRQLDASRFQDREEATRILAQAGSPAIAPLEEVARTGNQELRARAIFVLKQLAVEENPVEECLARDALDRLAENGSGFVRHRVLAAIDEVDRIRQSRTLTYLQERGAVLRTDLVIIEQRIEVTGGYGLIFDENWKGTLQDLSRLNFLRDLSALQMSGNWINDEIVETIAQASQVRLVSIRNATITDRAVAALARMGKLEGLELRYCPIADDSLPTLKRFQFLSRLKLIGTLVTREAAADLIDLLGASVVDHRQGGFLGVACDTLDQQCFVIRLVEGTAAAQAGIQVRDIITRVGDTAILSSDHLIETLSKYSVGDKVLIVWSRGEMIFEKEIELGEFTDLN